MNQNLTEIRQEARRRGLDWAAVEAAYREVKAMEREKREHPNEIRASAWMLYTASSPGCWDFWRHGFLARFGHRLARGADHTIIPGYDEIAQQIATMYPDFAGDDDTARLWDFLLSPYDRLPSREEMYRKALELAEGFILVDAMATDPWNRAEF